MSTTILPMPISVVSARNVCEALPAGLRLLLEHGEREESRAGPVLVAPGPVVTVTTSPLERVLFSTVRDANPFFHLAEAIWMLAGRDDSAFLDRFVSDFGARFAESGGAIHGAYGHRWRRAFGFDQLERVVRTLRLDPTSRQCVIQMWDATPPYENIHHGDPEGPDGGCDDLRGRWRDRPCNTHVYLRVREKTVTLERERLLDLTVCCRSNDAVWGAHGANAVHFSVLQEYLAARIGVSVGLMYQVSNNYHAYERELTRLRERAVRVAPSASSLDAAVLDDRYDSEFGLHLPPMFACAEEADEDVQRFCRWVDENCPLDSIAYGNSWFGCVAEPAMLAHARWRAGRHEEAVYWADKISAGDWHAACREWIDRRTEKRS